MSGILKSSDKTLDLLRNSSACASGVSTIMAALDIFQGKPKPTLGSSLGTSVSSNGNTITFSSIDDTITFTGTCTLDKTTVDPYSFDKNIQNVIINGYESIGDYAFNDCKILTTINLGNSVKTIGKSAFNKCKILTTINLGNSVKTIGAYAFNECTNLKTINLGSVESIGDYAFNECKSLTTINLGDSVESIGDYAFAVCKSLTTISIGNSVTTIGERAFVECTLTKVIISDATAKILNEEWSSPSPVSYSFYGSRYPVRFILP